MIQKIEIIYKDLPLTVSYTTRPAIRGKRDSLGVPLEPDEEATLEVEDVWLKNYPITDILDEKELDDIRKEIIEELEELNERTI